MDSIKEMIQLLGNMRLGSMSKGEWMLVIGLFAAIVCCILIIVEISIFPIRQKKMLRKIEDMES